MFSGNSQTAYGELRFINVNPTTNTDIGRGCFYKDVFQLVQCYYFSSCSEMFWTNFSSEPSKNGWREKLIREYQNCYDIDEKHACALAKFKKMSRRNFDRVEYSWKNLGDQRSVKRSRDETQCSDSDYYVRPKYDENREKRLCLEIGISGMFRGLARFCSSIMPTMHL